MIAVKEWGKCSPELSEERQVGRIQESFMKEIVAFKLSFEG